MFWSHFGIRYTSITRPEANNQGTCGQNSNLMLHCRTHHNFLCPQTKQVESRQGSSPRYQGDPHPQTDEASPLHGMTRRAPNRRENGRGVIPAEAIVGITDDPHTPLISFPVQIWLPYCLQLRLHSHFRVTIQLC